MKIYVHSAEKDIKGLVVELKRLIELKETRLDHELTNMAKTEMAEIELLKAMVDKYGKY